MRRFAGLNVEILSKNSVQLGAETVRRDELFALINLMDEYTPPPPSPQFKVGDYVRVIDPFTCHNLISNNSNNQKAIAYQCGRVRYVKFGSVAVEFAESLPIYGAYFGPPEEALPRYHGAWFDPRGLELVRVLNLMDAYIVRDDAQAQAE